MTFTDDDLKRLKELLEKSPKAPWSNTPWEVEGAYIYGPDNDSLLMMLWPRHDPTPEATRAAEVSIYTACDLIKELRNKADALLARLEVAEIVGLHANALVNCKCGHDRNCLNSQRVKESLEVWRKAAEK